MNVRTEFDDNPVNGRWDVSLKTTNANFMSALEEKSGNQQSPKTDPVGNNNICTKFGANPSDSSLD